MKQSKMSGPSAAKAAATAVAATARTESAAGAAQVADAAAAGAETAAESPPPTRSGTRSPSPKAKRIAWTPDRLWYALRSDDKRRVAASLGCGLSNLYAHVQGFRATSPGGSGFRHVVDRDIHLKMARMLDEAHYEALVAVAFVSPVPPPVFDHLLAAAGRGVEVRLLFRGDNLTGDIVRSLQRVGIKFRTLADLHAKFLITDTTAMNGSANFTPASADRASEVATFFSDPVLVHDLRRVFHDYWQRARPF